MPATSKPKPDEVLQKVHAHLKEHGPHKGTAPSLAKAIGITPEQLGRAAQRTRKGDFRKENGWWIPPTGRGAKTVWKVETPRSRARRPANAAA